MFRNFSLPEGQRRYKCTFSVTNRVIKLQVRWVEHVEYIAGMQMRKKKFSKTLWVQITVGRQAVKRVRFKINVKNAVWGSATEGSTRADGVRDRTLFKIFRPKTKRVTENCSRQAMWI